MVFYYKKKRKQSKPCLPKTDKTSSKFKIIKTSPLNKVYRWFVVAWTCRGLPLNSSALVSGGITFLSSHTTKLQKGKLLSSTKTSDLVFLIHCSLYWRQVEKRATIFEDNFIFLRDYLINDFWESTTFLSAHTESCFWCCVCCWHLK